MKHFIIPDTQVKPGVRTDHLEWAGNYIRDKRPDVVVCIGDFADMPSLSSYDVGKKDFEGRTYKADINASKAAMERLMAPFNRIKSYSPRLVLTLGNHEERINRAINTDRKLENLISVDDLQYKNYGWQVYPFLQVVKINGVCYSHYFSTGVLGRPATSASAMLLRKHMSSVMGHVQKREVAYAYAADGRQLTGIFAGSFYQHDEKYLNPQGNKHWRGCWMLHEVNNGSFDEMPLSLSYLRKRYG